MLKHLILATSIGLAAVAPSHSSFVSVGTNVSVLAASRSDQSQSLTPSSPAGPSAQANMTEMMKRHQQMMADMKAADLKLDELVKSMNAATGEAKTIAIAQLLTEMVRQHQAMHEHMGTMMDQQMMMGGRGMMNK
jgi:hypothetical protein